MDFRKIIVFLRSQLTQLMTLDLRSLVLFRIGLGFLILADLIIRTEDLEVFYTGKGILPADQIINWTRISNSFSLYLGSDSTEWQILLMIIAAVFAVMLIVGFKTRLATIMSWIFLISIQNRNPIVLQGGDVVFRLIAFWAMFLPLGKLFSIDSLKYKVEKINFKVTSFAALALITQIALIYLFAYLLKTGTEWHKPEFSAVYYALSIEQFSTPIGEWLAQNYELTRFLTLTTLTFEGVVAFLIFFPIMNWVTRTIAALGLISMHIGFAAGLHLGLFPFYCIVAATSLIPTQTWDLLYKFAKKRISYQKFESFVRKRVDWLKTKLPTHLLGSMQYKKEGVLQFIIINFVILLCLVIVIFWNYGGYVGKSYVNEGYRTIANFLRLDQKWNMFAPYPLKDDGWFVVTGYTSDGTKINLNPENPNLDGTKPKDVSAIYKNQRWRKFMMNLWSKDFRKYRNDYAYYLCRNWNFFRNEDIELDSLTIDFYLQRTQPYSPNSVKIAPIKVTLDFPREDSESQEKWECFEDRKLFQ